MSLALNQNKTWTVESLEEFIYRIKVFADCQYKLKDALIFWVAHSKLQKKMNKKVTTLMNLLTTKTKEVKKKRDIMKTSIRDEFLARKAQYPKWIPKYVKATRLNLDVNTYRLISVFK
jgi:hypothetical protein